MILVFKQPSSTFLFIRGQLFFFPNFYAIIIITSFKTVNNQPVEKVKISDNGALATGSRNLCDDMWGSDESTCGFDKDADGNSIWDSQVMHLSMLSPRVGGGGGGGLPTGN